MSVRDLLRATLLPSANDAAATLAVGTMGSTAAFVAEMNRRARQLGLRNTSFANPVGLDDPKNYSTAHDLAKLAVQLRRNEFFRRTVDLEVATLRSGAQKRIVGNRNALVRRVDAVNGVKTGFTRAGRQRPRRLGQPRRRDGHQRRARRAERARARHRLAGAAALRPGQLRRPHRAARGTRARPHRAALPRRRVRRGRGGRDGQARAAQRGAHDGHRQRAARGGRRAAAARNPGRHGGRAARSRRCSPAFPS